MSKNLKVIQITSRVLEIICRIVFIFCMIGAIGSLVGVVVLSLSYLSPSLVERIESEGGQRVSQLIGLCLIGVVVSLEGIIVFKAHKDYFVMEQKDGTPFTFEGAKAFRTLGIMNIVAPLIAMIVASIISAICNCWSDIRLDVSFGTGIAMILLSFVFAYGAEKEEARAQNTEGCCCQKEAQEPAETPAIEEK